MGALVYRALDPGEVVKARLASMVVVAALLGAWLPIASPLVLAEPAPSAVPAVARDGARDFDFKEGVWHTKIKRTPDPFTVGARSFTMEGTVTVRPVWGGKAHLEEIEVEGPDGHWQGLTMFLYNPEAHQWNQVFANSKNGVLNTPLIGSFQNGRGELFSQNTYRGRSILVRGLWSNITPDAHRYEESYSADGGATWHPAFQAELARVKQ